MSLKSEMTGNYAPIETEIEITPEMIEAGREAMSSRWLEFTGPDGFLLWDEVLRAVFAAMMAALKPPPSSVLDDAYAKGAADERERCVAEASNAALTLKAFATAIRRQMIEEFINLQDRPR